MSRLLQLIFIVLLTFATSTNAYADCGDCPGDAKGEKHAHDGDHAHGDKAEKAKECACAAAKDGGSAWCDHCKVGNHDGKKYNCQGCYKKATGESTKDCGDSCSHKDKAEKDS